MNEKDLSAKQKRFIFIIGICVIFLGVALVSFIDPDNKGHEVVMLITILPILVGLCLSFLLQDKTKIIKTLAFCLGAILISSGYVFLSLSDIGKLLGLYVGGFWAGSKWAKNAVITKIFEEKKNCKRHGDDSGV